MSRVGRAPVAIPSGVSVGHAEGAVSVKGPKGALSVRIPRWHHRRDRERAGSSVSPRRKEEDPGAPWTGAGARGEHGHRGDGGLSRRSSRSTVWATERTSRGRPSSWLWVSRIPSRWPIPKGLSVSLQEGRVRIEGIDRQLVGQFAANVRSTASAGALQGQGDSLRGRAGAPEGGQGGNDVRSWSG